MTVFLCTMALLALFCEPDIDASTWGVVVARGLHVLLVLGLAALAVFTWSQP